MDEKKNTDEKMIVDGEDGEEGDEGEDYGLVRRPKLPGTRNKGPKPYTEASGSRGCYCKAHSQSQFNLSLTLALICMM